MGRIAAPISRRPARLGPKPAYAASWADRIYGAALSWPRPSLEIVDLETLGAEVDELARESARWATCIRVRDARYLRWHWQEDRRTTWRLRGVFGAGGVLRGYAVVGTRGEGGEQQGVIVDLLARDYAALRALACDAWSRLREQGCGIVVCVYRDPRPWARIAMARAGFRRSLRRGSDLACGSLSPAAGEVVSQLRSWYLTGADSDL